MDASASDHGPTLFDRLAHDCVRALNVRLHRTSERCSTSNARTPRPTAGSDLSIAGMAILTPLKARRRFSSRLPSSGTGRQPFSLGSRPRCLETHWVQALLRMPVPGGEPAGVASAPFPKALLGVPFARAPAALPAEPSGMISRSCAWVGPRVCGSLLKACRPALALRLAARKPASVIRAGGFGRTDAPISWSTVDPLPRTLRADAHLSPSV